MTVCSGCDRCGDQRESGLYLALRPDHWVCAACYRELGRPAVVREALTAGEVQDRERRTRERMTLRGGADRYMVRAGKS